MAAYTKALVEWEATSKHHTVALRVGQVSHFCEFANDKALMIAVTAGLNDWTVDFETDGERDQFWRNVHITAVHK